MTITSGAGPTDTKLEAALAWVWAQGDGSINDHKCALSALLEWYEQHRPIVSAMAVEGGYLRLPEAYVTEICSENQRLHQQLAHYRTMHGRLRDHILSDPNLADSLVDFIEREVVG